MTKTKLVLLGTGTPNACPENSGPASAIIVNDQAYLIDFGPGVVRQASKAYFKGIDALRPDRLNIAFCTHLHTDHTVGLADLIFTPWVLEREKPLQLYGPQGLKDMAKDITNAYVKDLDMRLRGDEPANPTGYKTEVHELDAGIKDYGIIYKDNNVQVNAFTVNHGRLQSLAYKFITEDKTIVVSGDTCPVEIMKEKARDADILLHECEYTKGLETRSEQWQIYHRNVHTLSVDLAKLAIVAKPKLLVTYHRIYHMNVFDRSFDLKQEMEIRKQAILEEIKDTGYNGKVINGEDLDIFE